VVSLLWTYERIRHFGLRAATALLLSFIGWLFADCMIMSIMATCVVLWFEVFVSCLTRMEDIAR
jgi:hypothetical protein